MSTVTVTPGLSKKALREMVGGKIGVASCEAYLVQEALREAINTAFADGDASVSVERAWRHYHALGMALRATGVEPPQPPEGV